MSEGIWRLERCLKQVDAFYPEGVRSENILDLVSMATIVSASVQEGLERTFGRETVEYQRYEQASVFPLVIRNGQLHEVVERFQKARDNSLILLRKAISYLKSELQFSGTSEDLGETVDRKEMSNMAAVHNPSRPKIFVVHGHDEASLQAVARFLEKLGLEAIVLREQPDGGRAVIEKFEECAADVVFAVVLLTPDDIGGAATAGATGSRARQNVIFELGYFAGKLGRGRTCLMLKGAVEIPSDLHGVIYTNLDSDDGWKIKLVRELKAAKLDVDINKML